MVKNLPSVERSTKIRFGKHVPDSNDQEENTIVFNASNVAVPTPYSNAVYLSPVRNRTDYAEPQVVLLMYDKITKEVTESGEAASALVGGATLDIVTNRSNTTANTIILTGSTGFATYGNVGIANTLASHTVSVGSNLYIDEFGSNVLVVSGNVAVLKDMIIEGNLTVNGNTSIIYTENTSIKDAFIELGRDNTSGDTTLDLGVLMHRPDALSNVVVGYREGTDEFAIAYTNAKPTDKTFTPKTDEDINVHVYGLTHVDANIYAHEDVLVTGNVYVSTNVSVTEELTVTGNVYADKDLELAGNAYVSGNISVTDQLTVTGNVYADKDLELAGNAYVTGNVVASKDLTLAGNAYVSGNVNVTKQLSVTGNTYVSGNVEVTKALIVSANTHLKGDNVFITHTMDFLDPKTAIVTDQVSNVQIRLGQLENVSNLASNPIENEVLMYDGNQWMNTFPNHSFLTIKNAETTATMTSGNAVYISGYQNENLALVKLAKADSTATMPAIGVVYGDDIAPAAEGLAVAYGKVNQMNTNGYQVGKTLYVSNVYAGYLTTVKPCDDQDANPDLIQNVGVVTRQNPTHGAMFVTGIGRANDIPNAELITDYNEMNYVYVNDTNNDLKKITSANLNIPLTTAVSSSSNSAANAVTLRGVSITSGDGFHGDLTVAGNVTVDTNTFKVDAEANRVGILTASPGQTLDVRGAANVGALTTTSASVTDTTHSTSKDTGVLIVTNGGLGVEANIHSTNVFAASHIAVGTSATTKALDVRGTANVGVLTATSASVTDATEATSTTTGALKVTGGVGIQKDLYARDGHFSTDVSIGSLTGSYLPYADNGNKILKDSLISMEEGGVIKIAANVEIVGNIIVTGNTFNVTANDITITDRIIDIANNNPSHDLDIGILMEHPGYNIGIIHHGTHPHHLSFGYTSAGPGADHVDWKSDSHITANVWGHLITQNTVTVEYGNVYIVNGGLGIGIGDRSGDNVPDSKLYVTGNAHVTSNISTASNVLITGDAAATSKTTGALQVTGGAGIQGALYGAAATFDGVTSVTNGTVATSTTSGALKVSGGISTQDNVYVGRNVFITSNLNVDTNTLHVDSKANRVGIGKTDPTVALDVVGAGSFSGDVSGVAGSFSGAVSGTTGTFTGVTSVTNGTVATSTTTGALKVSGGISTQDNVYVGRNVFITSNLNVNTNTLHVDSEANRVGIGKTDPTVALDVVGAGSFSGDVSGVAGSFSGAVSGTTGTFSGDLAVDTDVLKVNVTDNRVGINKAVPTVALDVVGDGTFTGDVSGVAGSFSGAVSGTTGTFSGDLTVDTDVLKVNVTDNRVGINKAVPTVALDVVGDGTFTGDVSGVAGSFSGAVSGTTGTFTGVTSVTDDTDATSTTTGALKVAGGISSQKNIHASNVHITGGLITNTGQVTKKTYSYSGDLLDTQTIANSTIKITFSNHVFYAKVVAHLVETDDEVSTLAFECGGGNWGGTAPANNIALGPVSVFGGTSTNPWNSSITTTGTTVAFAPTTDMDGAGHYNVFIEYISQSSSGVVTKITEGTTDEITFNY